MQNIRKRYASDCSSSNLLDDERHHSTDTLHAVALGASDFGAMLLRAKHAKWISSRLRGAWREMVAKKSKHKGWLDVAEEVANTHTAMNHKIEQDSKILELAVNNAASSARLSEKQDEHVRQADAALVAASALSDARQINLAKE